MALRHFRATNFRCLERIEFEPEDTVTLIVGPNASGKTSILEAIAYLGRGRSFRGASTAEVTRHGEREFVLFGKVASDGREVPVGARNSPAGLEVHVAGSAGGGAAALAEALPLAVIGPDVHALVSGSPEERRRYLDWVAFHVEQGYVEDWRRFRRILRQRNAALRSQASAAELEGWNEQFVRASGLIDSRRRQALAALTEDLAAVTEDLVGEAVAFDYDPGWNSARGLDDVLRGAADRERQAGTTQFGPHRADLRVSQTARKARSVVSRGQQKLLASAMVIAASGTLQAALGRQLLLLLDDPAAELDADSLDRLLGQVGGLGAQVIVTSLDAGDVPMGGRGRMFHVEQGRLRPA